jgi:hypothetical protein
MPSKATERRACRVPRTSRTAVRHASIMVANSPFWMRNKEYAAAHPSRNLPRIHVLLHRAEWQGNDKDTERLHRLERMNPRRIRPRRVTFGGDGRSIGGADAPSRQMDHGFQAQPAARATEALRVVRTFQYTREVLAIETRGSLPAHGVIEGLNQLVKSSSNPGCDLGQRRDRVRITHLVCMGLSTACEA